MEEIFDVEAMVPRLVLSFAGVVENGVVAFDDRCRSGEILADLVNSTSTKAAADAVERWSDMYFLLLEKKEHVRIAVLAASLLSALENTDPCRFCANFIDCDDPAILVELALGLRRFATPEVIPKIEFVLLNVLDQDCLDKTLELVYYWRWERPEFFDSLRQSAGEASLRLEPSLHALRMLQEIAGVRGAREMLQNFIFKRDDSPLVIEAALALANYWDEVVGGKDARRRRGEEEDGLYLLVPQIRAALDTLTTTRASAASGQEEDRRARILRHLVARIERDIN